MCPLLSKMRNTKKLVLNSFIFGAIGLLIGLIIYIYFRKIHCSQPTLKTFVVYLGFPVFFLFLIVYSLSCVEEYRVRLILVVCSIGFSLFLFETALFYFPKFYSPKNENQMSAERKGVFFDTRTRKEILLEFYNNDIKVAPAVSSRFFTYERYKNTGKKHHGC